MVEQVRATELPNSFLVSKAFTATYPDPKLGLARRATVSARLEQNLAPKKSYPTSSVLCNIFTRLLKHSSIENDLQVKTVKLEKKYFHIP